MDLSERKKKILSAVVETNIKSNQTEAVSSKLLQEEYLPDFSSATIRNELNALEEMGYLTHLHTSSGRVPTKEGYEKYTQELMKEKKLGAREKELIREGFSDKLMTLKDIIDKSAETISKATNYTSVVYTGSKGDKIIKDIKLYPVSQTTQLVVVVTSDKVINEISNLGTNDEQDLSAAARIMRDLFVGKPISSLKNHKFMEKSVTNELKKYQFVFERVLDIIESKADDYSDNFSIAGKEKLISYPEFNDIDKVKKAVTLFDDSNMIVPLIQSGNDLEISINVGSDKSGLEDCSVITVSCNVKGDRQVTASVIGPMRMDYQKAISVLKEVAGTIEDTLNGESDTETAKNSRNLQNKKQNFGSSSSENERPYGKPHGNGSENGKPHGNGGNQKPHGNGNGENQRPHNRYQKNNRKSPQGKGG